MVFGLLSVAILECQKLLGIEQEREEEEFEKENREAEFEGSISPYYDAVSNHLENNNDDTCDSTHSIYYDCFEELTVDFIETNYVVEQEFDRENSFLADDKDLIHLLLQDLLTLITKEEKLTSLKTKELISFPNTETSKIQEAVSQVIYQTVKDYNCCFEALDSIIQRISIQETATKEKEEIDFDCNFESFEFEVSEGDFSKHLENYTNNQSCDSIHFLNLKNPEYYQEENNTFGKHSVNSNRYSDHESLITVDEDEEEYYFNEDNRLVVFESNASSEDSGYLETATEQAYHTVVTEDFDTIFDRYYWDFNQFITYPKFEIKKEHCKLTYLFLNFNNKMALPRELMLIIDDIAQRNCHLLEWEVFGNASEDMRVVLTWRKLDKTSSRKDKTGRWKLRQSSITKLEDVDMDSLDSLSPGVDNKEGNWESRGSGDSRSKRSPYNEGEYKGRTKDEDEKDEERRKKEAKEEEKRKHEEDRQRREQEEREKKDEEENKRKQIEEKKRKQDKENKRRVEEERERREDEERKRKQEDEKLRRKQEDERKKEEEEEQRKRKEEEEERKRKEEEENKKGQENENKKDDENGTNKTKKKNPFRKLTKDEKLKMKRNKLQLSFSIDDDLSISDSDLKFDDSAINNEEDTNKKKRGAYDEGEYKGRSKLEDEVIEEGKEFLDANGIEIGKEEDIIQLDDPDLGGLGKRGPYDEGKFSDRRKSQISEIEPAEMKDFDASKRIKFEDDSVSESGSIDTSIEKSYEIETLEDINTKKQAKKVLKMQRQKIGQSVDIPDEDGGVNGEVNGLSNGFDLKHSLGARELRESNMLSLAVDTGPYDEWDSPLKKKFELPKTTVKEKVQEEEPAINKHDSVGRLKPTLHGESVTGWERCVDCKYNSFCDDLVHKSEYMAILLNDRENDTVDTEACNCNVCNGGAVHNGCVYRELLRLKTEYRLFDKRNLCLCSTCIPFKYRKVCLRQELRNLRREGIDLYYRLTYHGDDGKEGYHPNINEYYEESDEEEEPHPFKGVSFKNVLTLEDLDMELTQADKINFRNCIDCSFNGFCDDLRHKKLYKLLLRLDVEEFDELDDDCSCLVCEFKGAAHSGCARREIIRLKYDFLLYDKRNLCYCPQCVPFKYRTMCLRQEMKLLRRRKNIDLYCNL